MDAAQISARRGDIGLYFFNKNVKLNNLENYSFQIRDLIFMLFLFTIFLIEQN